MRGLLPDKLVMSLILGSEGQRSGTPRVTFWPSPRPGVQTEGGFAGNRLHGARHARRKLGGSLSKCAEGGALSYRTFFLPAQLHVETTLACDWLFHEAVGIQASLAQERCLGKPCIQIKHPSFGTPDKCFIGHGDNLGPPFLTDAFTRC